MYTREEETTEESEHKLEIGLKGKWHNPFLLFSVSVPHTGPTHGCVCLFVCLSQRKDKQKDERSSSFHSFPLTLTYPKRNLQQRQQRRGRKEEPLGVHKSVSCSWTKKDHPFTVMVPSLLLHFFFFVRVLIMTTAN